MKRILTILRLFWGSALAAEAEYRLNFLLAFLASVLNLGGSLFGLFLFYRTGYQPGGWSWPAALLVLGFFTFLDGFAGTILVPNLNRIVQQIQDGTMDFVLLKPLDNQFWVSTRYLSLWGLPNVFFGLTIIGYAAWRLHLPPAAFGRGLLFLVPAAAIMYSLWFLLSTLSIWFVKIYNVTAVLRSVLEAGRYPVDAYPLWFRFVFTFIIPLAFLTTVPARAMTGAGIATAWLAAAALLAAVLLVFSRKFWRHALRSYTSASS